MIPASKNTNSESNNTSSKVMNTSPARQLAQSVNNQVKKVKSKVIDTSHLFKMLRNDEDKIKTQTELIERLETEQAETKAALDAMEQENAKMAQELEEIKKTMLSQESLDSYEDKIIKFEANIAKLTEELISKNMYAKQLEASNSALKTQWVQQKSEFNANMASEHRQELNKKTQDIKALQAKLKDMEEKNTELKDKNNELQNKNTQLQEEVTRLDEENMVLNINKELDDESDSDDESTDDESTDDEQEDTYNERVKQLEERIEQCVAEKNVAENLNKENAIKNKALEERIVALKTVESVNSQLVIDNKNLQTEINTLKTKYDAVCEQQKRHVKERRLIGLTPSPSPSHIEKSVPKVVRDKLVKLKAENVYLKSSCKAFKKQIYRNLQNKSIDELIATEPSASSDESSEDEGSTSRTYYTNLATKGSTSRNSSDDLLITTTKHVVTATAPRNNYSNSNDSSASPTLHCNNSAASPSSYRNSSTVSQSSYHNNNAASFTALPLIDSTTSLQSKKRDSSTDDQDKPTADSQETKKRRIEYPISTIIDQMIKSRKINEVDNADFKDIDKCITEISECYRRMKSIPCPEISDINSFGIPGEFIINAPSRWDKREKSYAWYLSLLSRKKEFYDYILNRIVIAFRAELRTKKMESYNARWMRLICMVLKSKNDMRQMMVILRELACRKNCQYHLFISVVNLIVGWKECVVDPCHNQVQSQTLQVCIAYIVKSNKTPSNAALIYSKIAPLVNWPTLETTVTMESLVDSNMRVIMEGLPTYKSSGNEDSFMRARAVAVRSLEMVFTSMDDWKSTFNEFLLTRVWPLLSDPIIGEVAVELLGTLGRLGVSDDVFVADREGVETILNTLRQYLDSEATTNVEKSLVKFAAVGCLKLGVRDQRCEAIVKANKL